MVLKAIKQQERIFQLMFLKKKEENLKQVEVEKIAENFRKYKKNSKCTSAPKSRRSIRSDIFRLVVVPRYIREVIG